MTQSFNLQVTPQDERPYSADVLYIAAEQWAPEVLPNVWELERFQMRYDAFEGTDYEAAEQIQLHANVIWQAIEQARKPSRQVDR